MTDRICPNKELMERTKSIVNSYIKQKEVELRYKQEELGNLPSRYVVVQTIKNEIDSLSEDIRSMKKLVEDLKCS